MFSKRKQRSARAGADQKEETTMTSKPREAPRTSGGTAMIGRSIHVDGKLNGDEDLVIEGRVKGTVELKNNSVTIGSQGEVQADVYAHTIYVDGRMDGNLVATEQVDRKSTRLNSSHVAISYAVFCLKKKKATQQHQQ